MKNGIKWFRIGPGFRRDLVVTLGAQGLSMLFMVGHILMLSRWLGAEGKGIQTLLLTIAQLASVILGLGVSASIVSILGPDPSRAGAVIRNQVRVLFFASMVLLVLSLAHLQFRWFPAFLGYETTISILALALLGQASFASILLALRRTWQYNMASLITASLPPLMLIVLHIYGFLTVSSSISAQTLGALSGLVYSLVILRKEDSVTASTSTRVALTGQNRIAALGYISSLLALMLFRGDIFLVSSLGGRMNQVGVYSVAIFAAELALKVPQWAATLLTAVVAADETRAAVRTIRLFWFSVSAAFLLFIVFLIGRPFLETLLGRALGPTFGGAWMVTMAVFPRVIFQAGGSIFAGNLAGKGYTFWHPGATLGGLVAVFFLDFLLVPKFGAVGGGMASSIGYLVALFIIFMGFIRNNGMDMRGFVRESGAIVRGKVRMNGGV